MSVLIAVIAFIVIIGVLVLIHELGHFFAARQAGVGVEEFGFGFPPRLFSKKIKQTLVSINWIPLGGFVKIKGIAGDDQQAGEHTTAQDSFGSQTFVRRFLILFAGILMNLLLCWFLLTVVYALGFSESVNGEALQTSLTPGQVYVTGVIPDTPAAVSGIQPGDKVISVNQERVDSIHSTQTLISSNDLVQLEVEREGQIQTLEVAVTSLGEVRGIGVGLGIDYPWWASIWLGLRETAKLVWFIFIGLGELVKGIFVKGQVSEGVVGPVGIAVISGQAVQLGLVYVLYFAALLSANLAIFNLLPLPALDGGRIVFLLIERIQGKPVNVKTEAIVHAIGFMGLLALAALITLRDVFHLFS